MGRRKEQCLPLIKRNGGCQYTKRIERRQKHENFYSLVSLCKYILFIFAHSYKYEY